MRKGIAKSVLLWYYKERENEEEAAMDRVWKAVYQGSGLDYDHVMDTYQRYFVQPANLIEEESGPNLTLTEQEQQVKELNEALQKSKNARLLVIGILAFVSLVLLLATINLALKVSFLKKEMKDVEEPEEDEDDVWGYYIYVWVI